MQPKSGYTLPVFACASAVAALRHLRQEKLADTISVNLVNPPETVVIPLEQVAKLGENIALAITRSEPGDNLDLTRNTPVWALVELSGNHGLENQILIQGGEGIGKHSNDGGKPAIYHYARTILQENLKPLLKPQEKVTVTIILPEGRKLAHRTSNSAFGIVEGLSLLGTSGISQPLSAQSQLDIYQQELTTKAKQFDTLVFCLGENGLNLAQKMGVNPAQLVKTANWLGPLLVTAGLDGVKGIILFGYHGKLIKLAGGIFHTHHYLADGRLEILTAHLSQFGLSTSVLKDVFHCETTDSALNYLRALDERENTDIVSQLYQAIASKIDRRSQEYIYAHTGQKVCVGSILFDRDRSIIIESENAGKVLPKSKI